MAMAADGAFERSYAMRRRRLDARHDAEIDELAARERALEGALEEERWGFGRMQDVTLQAGAREGASFQRISEELDTYSQFFKWTNRPTDPDDEANNGFGLVDRETGEGWDTNITWFQYFSKPDAFPDHVPSSSLAAGR